MKSSIQLIGMLCVVCSAFLFSACGSSDDSSVIEEQENYDIYLSSETASLNSSGGVIDVTVQCEMYYDIEIQGEWINFYDSEYINETTTKYIFKVASYDGDDIRTGRVSFLNDMKSKTFSIQQSGSFILKLSDQNFTFFDEGGERTVSIIGAKSITIVNDAEWVSCKNENNSSVLFSVQKLGETESSRKATIIINDTELNESTSFSIEQKHMISLTKSYISIEEGESESIKYSINSNEFTQNLVFSSSDESIATVSSSGRVAGISQGRCTISVSSSDGIYKASCDVSVKAFDITNHIELSIEDKVTDTEKGKHTVYYTFHNKSSKTVTITKFWIYFDGNAQIGGGTNEYKVYGYSTFQQASWRYASQMKVGFEVYYEYGNKEYRIYTDKMLDAYY